jgi:hypothetical protein
VQRSLHFVACGFFFKAIIVTSVKSLGHYPVSYMVLIKYNTLEKFSIAANAGNYSPNFGSWKTCNLRVSPVCGFNLRARNTSLNRFYRHTFVSWKSWRCSGLFHCQMERTNLYCFYYGILLMLKERVKSLLFQRCVQRVTPLYGCLWRRHRDNLKLNSFGYVQGCGCYYRGISFRRERRAVFSYFAWNAYTTNGGIVRALSPLEIEKSVYGDYTRTLDPGRSLPKLGFRQNWKMRKFNRSCLLFTWWLYPVGRLIVLDCSFSMLWHF